MRSIKFRAWNAIENRMENDLKLAMYLDGRVFVNQDDWRHHSKQFKLLEFTGLHDINGNPIFEGDLVRAIPIKWRDEFEAIKEVVFNDGKFCLEWSLHISEEVVFISLDCFKLEIVGNIQESPELLEPK